MLGPQSFKQDQKPNPEALCFIHPFHGILFVEKETQWPVLNCRHLQEITWIKQKPSGGSKRLKITMINLLPLMPNSILKEKWLLFLVYKDNEQKPTEKKIS